MHAHAAFAAKTDCCPAILPAQTSHPTLVMVGLNFRTASIAVREKLTFTPQSVTTALQTFSSLPEVEEVFLLSTCNRTEVYAVVNGTDDWQAFLRSLMAEHSTATAAELDACLYFHEGSAAARHLFRVASGLESMVLGEAEIVHQLKKATTQAKDEGTMGAILHRLTDTALAASKRARTQARYYECGLSVATVAVSACKRIYSDLSDLSVMVIGAGEVAEQTLHYLVSKGVRKVLIANRTYERAAQLAHLTGGEALAFADFPQRLPDIDVIVCCTACPHVILTADMLTPQMTVHRERPLLVLDLAVPRDVAPDVADIPGVELLNVDNFQCAANTLTKRRREKVSIAEEVIDTEAEKFGKWLASRRSVALVMELQQQIEDIRAEAAASLDEEIHLAPQDQARLIEQYTKALVRDILQESIRTMKHFTGANNGSAHIEVARKILEM
ncbi:MAG: glutamyl-tRNA reductase [Armatimonadota bacterium]